MDINPTEVSVEEIMRRIREEVRRRKKMLARQEQMSEEGPSFQPSSVQLELEDLFFSSEPLDISQTSYHLRDFLKYHDREFIFNAYRGILKREPDPEGLEYYLRNLRSGQMSKVEIIGRLRFSPEGKSKGVKIKGLYLPLAFALSYKVPVLGYFSRLFVGIGNLPTIIKNFEQFEASQYLRWQELQDRFQRNREKISSAFSDLGRQIYSFGEKINLLKRDIEARPRREEIEERFENLHLRLEDVLASITHLKEVQNAFEQRLSSMEEDSREKLSSLQEQLAGEVQVLREALEGRVPREEIEQRISALMRQIGNHKRHIVDMERRLLILLEEARKRLPEPISEAQIREMLKEEDHFLDALYFSLEDRFRGTREDIKERQRVYLPYVKEVLEKVGGGLVLDVGCGRGEWLELLKEEGIEALGIDINRLMVDQCQELGLNVIEGDAIDYLRGQKSNSFAVITGFHIVEHLPLKKMLALFDECLRVLKPGGMVIFETPNPENILVGACNFYTDPTHKKPIPPETLKFLVEERGFTDIKIIRLHKYSDYYSVDTQNPVFNQFFYSEMDYAVLAFKL